MGWRRNLTSWITSSTTRPYLTSLATGVSLSNTLRLPQMTVLYGVLPFSSLVLFVSLVVALPLTLLQVGVGQLSQQGAVRIWRAVPIFRGIAYLNLLTGFLGSCYFIVYIGISAAYIAWLWTGPIPMTECRDIYMTTIGYENRAVGMNCLEKVFLAPISQEPKYYGFISIIIFASSLLISTCMFSLKTSLKVTLYVMGPLVLILGFIIAVSTGGGNFVHEMFSSEHWSDLRQPQIWHAALIQVMFSSQLGTGYHVTGSGILFSKRQLVKTSVLRVGSSIVGGWLSILFWYSTSSGVPKDNSLVTVHILAYDSAVKLNRSAVWPCLTNAMLIFSGFITMVCQLYPLYHHLYLRFDYKWRLMAMISIIIGILLSLAIFSQRLDVMVILDEYALPLIMVFTVCVEVLALVLIYGWRNLYNDFEFLIDARLSRIWLFGWLVSALIILALTGWRIYGQCAGGWYWPSETWTFYIFVSILLSAVMVFIIVAIFVIMNQMEFNLLLKIQTAFKPSANWGPDDPLTRFQWLEWRAAPTLEIRQERVRRLMSHHYIEHGLDFSSPQVTPPLNMRRSYSLPETQQYNDAMPVNSSSVFTLSGYNITI